MKRNPLTSFVLKVLLWLPVTFWVWFSMGPALTWPVAIFSRLAMLGLFPEVIETIEPQGRLLEVVTQLTPPPQTGLLLPPGQEAVLVFKLNPLAYGYSLPLFMAMVFAVPGEEGQQWFRIGMGAMVLVLVQAWGVCFEILKTLVFNLGPGVAEQIPLSPWAREAIGLGYQFGYLVFPAVIPLVLWLALHYHYLIKLVPSLSRLQRNTR